MGAKATKFQRCGVRSAGVLLLGHAAYAREPCPSPVPWTMSHRTTVTLSNPLTGRVRIEELSASCGCTSVTQQVPFTLEAGASVTVTAEVNTCGREGLFPISVDGRANSRNIPLGQVEICIAPPIRTMRLDRVVRKVTGEDSVVTVTLRAKERYRPEQPYAVRAKEGRLLDSRITRVGSDSSELVMTASVKVPRTKRFLTIELACGSSVCSHEVVALAAAPEEADP